MSSSTQVTRRAALGLVAGLASTAVWTKASAEAEPSIADLFQINDDIFQDPMYSPATVLADEIINAKSLAGILPSAGLPRDYFSGVSGIPTGRKTPWTPPPPPKPSDTIDLSTAMPPNPAAVKPVSASFVELLAVALMAAAIGRIDMFTPTINRGAVSQRIIALTTGTDGLAESDNAERVMCRSCHAPDGRVRFGEYLVDPAGWGIQLSAELMKPAAMAQLMKIWSANNPLGYRRMQFSLYKAFLLNSASAADVVKAWKASSLAPLVNSANQVGNYPPNWYNLDELQQSTSPIIGHLHDVAQNIAGTGDDWQQDAGHWSGGQYPVWQDCTRTGKTYGQKLAAFVTSAVAPQGLATGDSPNNVVTTREC